MVPSAAQRLRLGTPGAILIAMVTTATDVDALPLAPKNPLPLRRLGKLGRTLETGQEVIREAGGRISRIVFAPKWLVPPIVVVTSPDGIRDVLGATDAVSGRGLL